MEELSVMTVKQIAKKAGKDASTIHRILRKRKDIERLRMVQQPSGQQIVVVSRKDGEALIESLKPGLHQVVK